MQDPTSLVAGCRDTTQSPSHSCSKVEKHLSMSTRIAQIPQRLEEGHKLPDVADGIISGNLTLELRIKNLLIELDHLTKGQEFKGLPGWSIALSSVLLMVATDDFLLILDAHI